MWDGRIQLHSEAIRVVDIIDPAKNISIWVSPHWPSYNNNVSDGRKASIKDLHACVWVVTTISCCEKITGRVIWRVCLIWISQAHNAQPYQQQARQLFKCPKLISIPLSKLWQCREIMFCWWLSLWKKISAMPWQRTAHPKWRVCSTMQGDWFCTSRRVAFCLEYQGFIWIWNRKEVFPPIESSCR